MSDEELKLLRTLADSASQLQRGCDCEYDYRCGNCEQVIAVRDLADEARAKR